MEILIKKLPVDIQDLIYEYVEERKVHGLFTIDMTYSQVFIGNELITNYDKKKIIKNIEKNYDKKIFLEKTREGGIFLFDYTEIGPYLNNYKTHEEYFENNARRCYEINKKYYYFFIGKCEATDTLIIKNVYTDANGFIIKINLDVIYITAKKDYDYYFKRYRVNLIENIEL